MIIGVIGGGQLCRMMAQEIQRKRLPHKIIAIDPTPDCPAKEFIQEHILGDFKDQDKIRELAKRVDVITYEIELANSLVLKEIELSGKIVAPSPYTLYTIQDKFRQKTFLKERGIPVPDFMKINSRNDLVKGLEFFGYPALLKATQDSYDGRGNYVIKSKEDIDKAFSLFEGRPLMLERFVDFTKEISIMAARNISGEIKTYPASENVHKDNILLMTVAPGKLSDDISTKAKKIAYKIMEEFDGAGVFGIEMFVERNGNVSVNEIAPRVHNSGHHTIEACETSQFEQHIRAITNMPLGNTDIKNNAIMCNILGDETFSGTYEVKTEKDIPLNSFIHMYGKHEAKPKRKMGHVTILTDDVNEAQTIRNLISLKQL